MISPASARASNARRQWTVSCDTPLTASRRNGVFTFSVFWRGLLWADSSLAGSLADRPHTVSRSIHSSRLMRHGGGAKGEHSLGGHRTRCPEVLADRQVVLLRQERQSVQRTSGRAPVLEASRRGGRSRRLWLCCRARPCARCWWQVAGRHFPTAALTRRVRGLTLDRSLATRRHPGANEAGEVCPRCAARPLRRRTDGPAIGRWCSWSFDQWRRQACWGSATCRPASRSPAACRPREGFLAAFSLLLPCLYWTVANTPFGVSCWLHQMM